MEKNYTYKLKLMMHYVQNNSYSYFIWFVRLGDANSLFKLFNLQIKMFCLYSHHLSYLTGLKPIYILKNLRRCECVRQKKSLKIKLFWDVICSIGQKLTFNITGPDTPPRKCMTHPLRLFSIVRSQKNNQSLFLTNVIVSSRSHHTILQF